MSIYESENILMINRVRGLIVIIFAAQCLSF